MRLGILIIEDNFDAAQLLKEILESLNHLVFIADNKNNALSILSNNPEDIDVAILDLHIPESHTTLAEEDIGFQILKIIKKDFSRIEVIVLTAYDEVSLAVKSIKLGAYDFLTKPPKIEILSDKLKKIADYLRIEKENIALKREISFKNIVGASKNIQNVLGLIGKIANSNASVFIEGETGTGKELIAKAIHEESHRRGNPFVAINCAAIPNELMESELLGYEKGAFTGAFKKKTGYLEEAHKGTLFLDEIGEMKYELQAKLLRAIEEKKFFRVGGQCEVSVDIRIVSATNKNIKQLIKEGTFRDDLYFRLNDFTIMLPPLKKRKSDIPLLAKHFLDGFCNRMNLAKKDFSKDAIDKLSAYPWPGNVRELKKVVERAVILNPEKSILNPHEFILDDKEIDFKELELSDLYYLPLKEAREAFEKKYIKFKLRESTNQAESAKKAGVDRSNFNKLIKKHKLI